jgi:hypothetical protein
VTAASGDPRVLDWLVEKGGLERSGNRYRHNVSIFLIHRSQKP